LAAVATLGAGVAAISLLVLRSKRRYHLDWKCVGTVEELGVYPMKGCRGKSVPEATFVPLGARAGVFRDRTFGFIKER